MANVGLDLVEALPLTLRCSISRKRRMLPKSVLISLLVMLFVLITSCTDSAAHRAPLQQTQDAAWARCNFLPVCPKDCAVLVYGSSVDLSKYSKLNSGHKPCRLTDKNGEITRRVQNSLPRESSKSQ